MEWYFGTDTLDNNLHKEEVRKLKKTKLRQELRKQRQQVVMARRIAFVIIVLIAAVYIIGTVFYSKHFYGRGTVFGIRMTNLTVEK